MDAREPPTPSSDRAYPAEFESLRAMARRTYGEDAEAYARGRPDYPDRVYAVLRSTCGITARSRVLEIGPGPGMVTRHLLTMGARVVAVEPDPGFGEYLAQELPEVRVIPEPFEQADVGAEFDAVVAATSFHWLDQSIALPRLHRVLRPGGWAAIWWTVFSDPYREDPLLAAAGAQLGVELRNPLGASAYEVDREARCADLEQGAGLVDVTAELIAWNLAVDAERARTLFATMIMIRQLPDEQRTRVLDTVADLVNDRFGGSADRPHLTALYCGRKPPA
jgi:SAM-dependent methyltransferase